MSKNIVVSQKFSDLEVVGSAKFDDEIVYADLVLDGTSLAVICSEDISLTSTGTASPWGISLISNGPVGVTSARSNISLLAGTDATTDYSGNVYLGYKTASSTVNIFQTQFDSGSGTSRIGFFAATPVIKQTAVTPATTQGSSYVQADANTVVTAVNGIITRLQAYGLLA